MEVEQAYANIVTMLEGLLDHHPDYGQIPDGADRAVMSEYYFFGRSIEVDDIQSYRRSLLADRPQLQSNAEAALTRFMSKIGMAGDPAKPQDWI